MKNFFLLLSDIQDPVFQSDSLPNLVDIANNNKPFIFLVLAILLFFTLIADRILGIIRKIWETISENIYDPIVDSADPFGDHDNNLLRSVTYCLIDPTKYIL
jgi:hypothetical protein